MTSNITNLDGKRAGRYVGTAQRRIDGRLKVTGGAKYAGEFPTPGLTYGYVVSSEITHGSIVRIDSSAAEAVPARRSGLKANNERRITKTPSFTPTGVGLMERRS